MLKDKLDVPVLLLIFNRPDTTFKVFEQIRKYKPSRFFIAADGPREGVAKDKEKCDQAREIVRQVDWDCEVKTIFRDKNLGCRIALSSAINWFFENVEEGIILEDDCVPDLTFFQFCKELLEYYRNDQRIMTISGSNLQLGRKFTEYSYYFSRYPITWGWASWRRAWNFYDVGMKLWLEIREKGLLFDILENKREVSYWGNIFEKVYQGKIDTWDYQWLFACWLQRGLTILPDVNLVSNIGFGSSGTHTKGKNILANLERKQITFLLMHPPYMFRDKIADKLVDKYLYSAPRIYKKIINIIYGR